MRNSPISVPRATTMMAKKNLLMPGNAGIAVSFERRFPPIRLSPSFSKYPPPSEHRICAKRVQLVLASCNRLGDLVMRSKLAISALVVMSLFSSTLIASAQTQAAPGASNQGTVSPGATSGKKTQHEKGTTTGSSMRNGANKGGAANPSDQDDAGSGTDYLAAPKSGSKH
jgi:hypothetical protein